MRPMLYLMLQREGWRANHTSKPALEPKARSALFTHAQMFRIDSAASAASDRRTIMAYAMAYAPKGL